MLAAAPFPIREYIEAVGWSDNRSSLFLSVGGGFTQKSILTGSSGVVLGEVQPMRCNLAMLTGLLAGLALGPALAESTEIGMLTCTLVELQAKPGAPEPGGQFRSGRCSFKPLEGPEEVYDAKVEGISLTPTDGAETVMWVVKGQPGTALEPGLLEQLYEADRGSRDDATPVLFGFSNLRLAFHNMADKPEGQASAPTKPRPSGFVILRIELNLKAASG